MLRTVLATVAVLAFVAVATAEPILQVDFNTVNESDAVRYVNGPLPTPDGWTQGGKHLSDVWGDTWYNTPQWGFLEISPAYLQQTIGSYNLTYTANNDFYGSDASGIPADPAYPGVTLSKMYRDGVALIRNSLNQEFTMEIAGLTPSTGYSMTVWAWNRIDGTFSTWSDITGGALTLVGTITPTAANPTSDTDYSVHFNLTSDADGKIKVKGVGIGTNNYNGLTVNGFTLEQGSGLEDQPMSWNIAAGGNFQTAGNWVTPRLPGGNRTAVTFGSAISAPSTVFNDVALTVKSVTFDSPQGYALAGKGTLTLSAIAGNGAIAVLQGDHEFQLPVKLGGGTDVSVATAASLTFNNALDLAGNTLTKVGAGTMYINNKLNLGTGGQIVVSEGAVELSGQLVLALGSIPTGALTLLDVGAGSVGGQFYGLAEGTEVDLGYNSTTYKFKISYAGGTGSNDVVLNLIPNHIPGDINGDLIVDQGDYTVWYNHYGQTPATWADGDVTGDNIVDQADYTVWYNHYGATGANVPEPMTMALLAIGGLAMLRRKK